MFVMATLDQSIKMGEVFGKYCQSQQNYGIKRNKVEARWHSIKDGYPVVKGVPIGTQSHIYWEFHLKLVIEKTEEQETQDRIERLRQAVHKSFPCSRLSKSAMSSVDARFPNKTSRIVTLRLYDGDKSYAENELNKLMDFLKKSQEEYMFEIKKNPERELSVYDSNVSHDLGWIHMGENDLDKTKLSRQMMNMGALMIIFFVIMMMYQYM